MEMQISDVANALSNISGKPCQYTHSSREQKISYGGGTHVGDAVMFSEPPKETIHTHQWVLGEFSEGRSLVVSIETPKEPTSDVLFVEHEEITVKLGKQRIGVPAFEGLQQIPFGDRCDQHIGIAKVLVAGIRR